MKALLIYTDNDKDLEIVKEVRYMSKTIKIHYEQVVYGTIKEPILFNGDLEYHGFAILDFLKRENKKLKLYDCNECIHYTERESYDYDTYTVYQHCSFHNVDLSGSKLTAMKCKHYKWEKISIKERYYRLEKFCKKKCQSCIHEREKTCHHNCFYSLLNLNKELRGLKKDD